MDMVRVTDMGSSPDFRAKLYVVGCLPFRPRRIGFRQRRKGMILKGFATLRVAQKLIPFPAKFGSLLQGIQNSANGGITNLFSRP